MEWTNWCKIFRTAPGKFYVSDKCWVLLLLVFALKKYLFQEKKDLKTTQVWLRPSCKILILLAWLLGGLPIRSGRMVWISLPLENHREKFKKQRRWSRVEVRDPSCPSWHTWEAAKGKVAPAFLIHTPSVCWFCPLSLFSGARGLSRQNWGPCRQVAPDLHARVFNYHASQWKGVEGENENGIFG